MGIKVGSVVVVVEVDVVVVPVELVVTNMLPFVTCMYGARVSKKGKCNLLNLLQKLFKPCVRNYHFFQSS